MNKLTTFINNNLNCQVRTLEIDGNPWLVGRDVCDALGYVNSRDALNSHVDDEDRQVILKSEIATLDNVPNRGLTVINESGLYALVFSSKVPIAKAFKRWVTAEVLPEIRQTGCYQRQMTPAEILAGQAQLLVNMERRQAEMEALQEQHTQQIAAISEAATIGNDTNWRDECNHIIRSYAQRELGGNYREANCIVQCELERRARCRLRQRKCNMQERMRNAGIRSTQINNMTNVDVIAADPRLTEIYIAICRELAISSVCETVA